MLERLKWAGVAGLAIGFCGVVVTLDTAYQRGLSADLLANGVEATATEVELRVITGKGGTFIDEVDVAFQTADGQLVNAELIANLGDPEGAESGRQAPAPGTRYAAPLPLRYDPDLPSDVIAVVDAQFFANDDETLWVGGGLTAAGAVLILVTGFAFTRNARSQGFKPWHWTLKPPRRH